jgi:signal transduction histidine kinase
MPACGQVPELPVQPIDDGWMLTALVASLTGGLPEPDGAIAELAQFFGERAAWADWLGCYLPLTDSAPATGCASELPPSGLAPPSPAAAPPLQPIDPRLAELPRYFWLVQLPAGLVDGGQRLLRRFGPGGSPPGWLVPLQRVCQGLLQHRLLIEQFEQQVALRAEQIGYDFAYGLTHEINNPLANIAARAGQLASQPVERLSGPGGRRALETIQQQAWRAHEMLAELMLAVRPPQLQPVRCDLKQLMVRWLPQLEAAATQWSLTLNCHLPDRPLWGWVDPSAVGECVRALVRNATQACRAGDHIDLWLEATGDPHYLRLAVHDTGPGLSWSEQQRAWNWYYCGRQAGRGLGLGLSKVRRLITQQSGQVWLESQSAGGCRVELRLPCG